MNLFRHLVILAVCVVASGCATNRGYHLRAFREFEVAFAWLTSEQSSEAAENPLATKNASQLPADRPCIVSELSAELHRQYSLFALGSLSRIMVPIVFHKSSISSPVRFTRSSAETKARKGGTGWYVGQPLQRGRPIPSFFMNFASIH